MLQAAEIADFFISLGNAENEDPMTNLRINKLLYFAQGWNLQRFGRPLFDEAIKAWKYGPVVETIFRKYHNYGRNIITECSPSFSLAGFTSDEIQLLLDVYNKYRTFLHLGSLKNHTKETLSGQRFTKREKIRLYL